MQNFEQLALSVCQVARQAGDYIRGERANFSVDKVERKHAHDYVSYVDKSSEKMIVKALRELLPEAGFITDDGSEGDPEQDECRCGEPLFHFFPDTFFRHFHHLLLHFGAELIELLASLSKITEFHGASSLPKIVPKIAKRTEVSKITA